MRKSGYLDRLQAERAAHEMTTKELTMQLMADSLAITLNDPAVMGKDTFGGERLKRVMAALVDTFTACYPALTDDPEADYVRARMDSTLRRIFGVDFEPFEVRYPKAGTPK